MQWRVQRMHRRNRKRNHKIRIQDKLYTKIMDYKAEYFKTNVEPALKNASTAEDMLNILLDHYHLPLFYFTEYLRLLKT